MKIEITTRIASSPFGAFEPGSILQTPRFNEAFLNHLVRDCNAARIIEPAYDTKVDEQVEVKKKTRSSRSSAPGKVSRRQTAKLRSGTRSAS